MAGRTPSAAARQRALVLLVLVAFSAASLHFTSQWLYAPFERRAAIFTASTAPPFEPFLPPSPPSPPSLAPPPPSPSLVVARIPSPPPSLPLMDESSIPLQTPTTNSGSARRPHWQTLPHNTAPSDVAASAPIRESRVLHGTRGSESIAVGTSGKVVQVHGDASSLPVAEASIVCIGSRVSGVVLYGHSGFDGTALVYWRASEELGGPPSEETVCMRVAMAIGSLRVVCDDHAIMATGDGSLLVLRHSIAHSTMATLSSLHGRSVPFLSPTHPHAPINNIILATACLGRAVRAIELYASPRWARGRSLLHEPRGIACHRLGGGDDTEPVHPLQRWRQVGSIRLRMPTRRPCADGNSNEMCHQSDDASAAPSTDSKGELLPYRTPMTPPLGFPSQLAKGAHGSFHAYNPSLLVTPDGRLELITRWSNYNFCTRRARFEDNVAAANGALMSFVVRGVLNTSSWQLEPPGLRVWEGVTRRYPLDERRTLSGAEDPRAVRHAGQVWLWVAVWEPSTLRDGIQWQHVLRLAEGTTSEDEAIEARASVSETFVPLLAPWVRQFALPRGRRVREKNWAPFVWRGDMYVEYSLEPRLVLQMAGGDGTPVLPMTSSAATSAWVRKLGPVSGGTPAIELHGSGVFLALGHVKLFRKKGARTGTSSMCYKHFWYAFEARPPFGVLGTSLPFTLPSQLPETPSIQFATGLVLMPATKELIVSYGEQDCHATLGRFSLSAVLAATLGRRRDAPPSPLLTSMLILDGAAGGGEAGGVPDGGSHDASLERLRQLLPMISALANASALDGESDDDCGDRSATGRRRREAVPCVPRVRVLLLWRHCESPLPMARAVEGMARRIEMSCVQTISAAEAYWRAHRPQLVVWRRVASAQRRRRAWAACEDGSSPVLVVYGADGGGEDEGEMEELSAADVAVVPRGQARALVSRGVRGAWAAGEEAAVREEQEVVRLARGLALERGVEAEWQGGGGACAPRA